MHIYCIKSKEQNNEKEKALICAYSLSLLLCIILLIQIITANAFAIEDTKGIKLPIIMYHSVLKDSKRSGDYVISTTELKMI